MAYSPAMAYELEVRVSEARGLQSAGSVGSTSFGGRAPCLPLGPHARVVLECTVDGATRRTLPAAMVRAGGGGFAPVWSGGEGRMSWRLEEETLPRIKAHAPRFKISLLDEQAGQRELLGFVLQDLRDPTLLSSADAAAPRWLRLHGAEGAEICVAAKLHVVPSAPRELSLRAAVSSAGAAAAAGAAGGVAVAAAPDADFVVVGENGESDFTLSITLTGASALHPLLLPHGAAVQRERTVRRGDEATERGREAAALDARNRSDGVGYWHVRRRPRPPRSLPREQPATRTAATRHRQKHSRQKRRRQKRSQT